MTDEAMSPLRRRMIEDMTIRKLAPKTQEGYIRTIKHFAAFLGRNGVTFRWKDYRIKGRNRYKAMTLATYEFIRRFLIHILPNGFHRIRHYGLFASSKRVENIARIRELLVVPPPQTEPADAPDRNDPQPCPHCGGHMIIIETFARGSMPRYRPKAPMVAIRIDTS